ncbi:MAG: ParB/RepB/Spo0J family partition protein [Ruminiclostridium sp.]|nr:ParB/RepB/Spo0J family partition protein [Ruminiclostridium sp.]
MAKKSALNDDFLDGLFDDGLYDSDEGGVPQKLKITDIEPNKKQPRKDFNEAALTALAENIAELGVIQPLTVRPYGDSYQIVAGERRWRAAKMAGLKEVPVRIMELSDEQTMVVALIENLQREDLNPIETALGYKQLMDTFEMTQEEVAKRVGKPRPSVANALRLLSLPDDLQENVRNGELSVGHCKVILGIQDDEIVHILANKAMKDGISVRALERLAKQMTADKPEKKHPPRDTYIVEAEISMTDHIGKPVRIDKTKDKYTFSIDCANEEELKELIAFLSKIEK